MDNDMDVPREAAKPNLDVSLDDLIRANKRRDTAHRPPHHDERRRRGRHHGDDRRRSPVRGDRRRSPSRSPHRRHSHFDGHRRRRSPPPHRPNLKSHNYHNNNNTNGGGVKLIVSNLHYDVSRDDLKALFETVGPVSRVYMHFDRAGRSNGVAEVTFTRMEDARVAQERYHNMPLDGYPMQIEAQTAPLRSDHDMALD